MATVAQIPAGAHVWQLPAQLTLQQNPSIQAPLLHCESAVHGISTHCKKSPAGVEASRSPAVPTPSLLLFESIALVLPPKTFIVRC